MNSISWLTLLLALVAPLATSTLLEEPVAKALVQGSDEVVTVVNVGLGESFDSHANRELLAKRRRGRGKRGGRRNKKSKSSRGTNKAQGRGRGGSRGGKKGRRPKGRQSKGRRSLPARLNAISSPLNIAQRSGVLAATTVEEQDTAVAVPTGRNSGGSKVGFGTHFTGMGTPFGGCGVPPSKAVDDRGKPLPFIALNTNSEFKRGANCGRWVEMKLGQVCKGGSNSAFAVCRNGRFENDGQSGKVLYGYVMDSCADNNFWCQDDAFHLDVSKPYLQANGLAGDVFNARELIWKYIDRTPPGWVQNSPKFMFKDGSKWLPNGGGFFAVIIIHNLSNGVSRVEQQVGGSFQQINQFVHLGNMFQLKTPSEYRDANPDKSFTFKVYGKSNELYGTFKVKMPCGNSPCARSMDAQVS